MYKQLQVLLILLLISGFNAGIARCQRTPDGLRTVVQVVPAHDSIPVSIDTFCASWHICVHDAIAPASASFINDPNGEIYGHPGRVFKNVNFDYTSDTNQIGEIIFNGIDTEVCFDVLVSNPLDTAYAPLVIFDKSGRRSQIEFFYKSQRIRRSVLPKLPERIDSLIFSPSKIGAQQCSTVVYIHSPASGTENFAVEGLHMNKNDGVFTIASTIPQVPTVLKPGDTLKVGVCYKPIMAGISNDSLILQSGCFSSGMFVTGFGSTPSISATDIDFHTVGIDSTDWEWLDIYNTGNIPYNITKSWILSDTINFSMEAGSAGELPEIISPSGSRRLKIYFHPKSVGLHTARIDWTTDIDTTYGIAGKKYSTLKGTGTPPIVNSVNLPEILPLSFSIRPNPTSGNAAVCFFSMPLENNATLALFDVLGRKVLWQNIPQGIVQIEFPIGSLENGIYYVRLTSEKGVATQKMEVLK